MRYQVKDKYSVFDGKVGHYIGLNDRNRIILEFDNGEREDFPKGNVIMLDDKVTVKTVKEVVTAVMKDDLRNHFKGLVKEVLEEQREGMIAAFAEGVEIGLENERRKLLNTATGGMGLSVVKNGKNEEDQIPI